MEEMQHRNKKKDIIIAIIVGLVVIAIGLALWTFFRGGSSDGAVQGDTEVYAMAVKDVVSSSQGSTANYLTGVIEPKAVNKYTINTDKGKVDEVYVKVGDSVEKGQKLFHYSNPDGDLEIREAQLELEMQQAAASESQAKVDRLNKQLKEADDEEKATLTEERNQAQLEVKQNQLSVEKAQAALSTVQTKFSNSIVYADASGVVRKVDDGQMNGAVSADSSNSNASTFIEVVDDSAYYVKGAVDEFRRDELSKDQQVTIIDRNDESVTWPGKITAIGDLPESDGSSSEESSSSSEENPVLTKYPFTIEVSAGEGMNIGRHVFISTEVMGDAAANADTIALPSDFIFEKDGKSYVWLVKDGKAKKTAVETGEPNQETMTTEVKSGVKMDDYILYPDNSVKAGMEVQTDASTE
ncbi:efflux RND transporter periplasmic adaptor subunit [Listeria costaricensis]|uniref:efflux RND transporter periplasmic adaptor subunit n=1 Tax=Listeria costaricensis TaxID=2026604 RepID=UPI000C07F196|nr:efflux RND transporter periplasmic adaptor subunit [Listeria costaricensis]